MLTANEWSLEFQIQNEWCKLHEVSWRWSMCHYICAIKHVNWHLQRREALVTVGKCSFPEDADLAGQLSFVKSAGERSFLGGRESFSDLHCKSEQEKNLSLFKAQIFWTLQTHFCVQAQQTSMEFPFVTGMTGQKWKADSFLT